MGQGRRKDRCGVRTLGVVTAYTPTRLDSINPHDFPRCVKDTEENYVVSEVYRKEKLFRGLLPKAEGITSRPGCAMIVFPYLLKVLALPHLFCLDAVLVRCVISRPRDRSPIALSKATPDNPCRVLLQPTVRLSANSLKTRSTFLSPPCHSRLDHPRRPTPTPRRRTAAAATGP